MGSTLVEGDKWENNYIESGRKINETREIVSINSNISTQIGYLRNCIKLKGKLRYKKSGRKYKFYVVYCPYVGVVEQKIYMDSGYRSFLYLTAYIPTFKNNNTRCIEEFKYIEKNKTLKNEIIEAIKFAYSLEKMLYDNNDNIKTKQDVINFYRMGFSKKITEGLTQWSWIEKDKTLRATEAWSPRPEDIKVHKFTTTEATVYFRNDEGYRIVHQGKKFTKNKLKKIDGKWKVIYTKETDYKP